MKKVISATITPLKNDGSLDKAGLKKIFDRNIRHGLDGIFILGSMGEWSSFSTGFKEEFVAEAAEITAGKTDLLVGINATSLPLALENMKTYSQYKFDSYVYMLPGAPFALDPVKTVLTVLDKADRDVYFYYCPPNNNKIFTLDDFAKIMAEFVGYSADEDATKETVKSLYEEKNCLIDTHTAVAIYATKCYINDNKAERTVLTVSTASAYKFAKDVYSSLTGKTADDLEALSALCQLTGVEIPAPLANIDKRTVLHTETIKKEAMETAVLHFASDN